VTACTGVEGRAGRLGPTACGRILGVAGRAWGVLVVVGWLVVVEVGIRVVPLPTLARWLGASLWLGDDTPMAGKRTVELTPAEVRALHRVDRVLARWPWGRGPCLRRSLVVAHVLRRRDPVLRLGVRPEGADLGAHAWLEVGGTVLGAVPGYAPLVAHRHGRPMPRGRTRLHGLCIESPFELGPPVDPGGDPDLRLALGPARPVPRGVPPGEVVVELRAGDRTIHLGTDDGRRAVLRVHGLCEFVVARHRREVTCYPDPSTGTELLTLLVRGTLLAFLLGIEHELALHASAVATAPDGSAVAFAARSGMGKSTLAALACRRGAAFITDDLLRVGFGSGGEPQWVGCAADLRLRPAAAALVDGLHGPWHARHTVDGRLALRPPGVAAPSGPLRAVVIPRPSRTSSSVAVTRLGPVEATVALSSFPRLAVWRSPRLLQAQLAAAARVAACTSVYVADVPWGPPFPRSVVDDLFAAVDCPIAGARVAPAAGGW